MIYQGDEQLNKVVLKNYQYATPYKIYPSKPYSGYTTVTKNKTNTTTTIPNNNNKNSNFNVFDSSTTKLIKSKGNNSREVAAVLNDLIKKNKNSTSDLDQLVADYLHSVYNINRKVLFGTAMRIDYYEKEVTNKLPNHIQEYLRKLLGR